MAAVGQPVRWVVALTILLILPVGAMTAPAHRQTPAPRAAWKPGMDAAERFASRRQGVIGFAVVDPNGNLHQRNGYGRAHMASTFKVMLIVAYLRRASDRDLNDYDKSLLRPMIRRSDNDAATTIRNMLGRGPIEELADDADMHNFRWNDIWGYCLTSARDQAFFMRRLRHYVPNRHWDFARKQLAHIISYQRWGIGQIDTGDWKLYFKGGWGSGSGLVDHQVALLKNGDKRIGIGILTENNPDHAYGKATLKGIAERLLRNLPA